MPIINNFDGNEVEITKIVNVVDGVEYDITDVYLADKQVFTVWGESEGALPQTFNANGDNAVEWQVYGETGGVGQRTANLFDKNDTEDAYIDVEGNIHSSTTTKTSNYIPVLENTSYTLYMSGNTSSTNLTAIDFFDLNKDLLSYTTYVPEQGSQSIFINTPARASYVRFSVNSLRENVMLTAGSTAPASFIPYGYEVPMEVGDGNTSNAVNLYIGATPLDEGEYTSYKDQKIYKYVSGVLTPTDPPVPIPALPTIDGVTVVDTELDPSAVQPEKAVIKYRKENT